MSEPGPGLLSLTHSSRITMLRFCSRDVFIRRFSQPDRLKDLPPFEHLSPAKINGGGGISFFSIAEDVAYLGTLKTARRIQDVQVLSLSSMVVGYEGHLEVWSMDSGFPQGGRILRKGWSVLRTVKHPHMVGIRTVHRLDDERVLVCCSGADAVFVVNHRSGSVEQTLIMPEDLYQQGYRLTQGRDLHHHYIANNYQRTHINGAWPFDGGRKVVVSALIQGLIGVFDLNSGEYTELVRGFQGCHGARVDDQGRIYFADSCSGSLVFLDRSGQELDRYQTDSVWLHDACQLKGGLYAFAVADKNELKVVDIKTGETRFRRKFTTNPLLPLQFIYQRLPWWIGNSLQFLSYEHGVF